ncbi:MAG: lipoprotein [Pseudomonadota bacterium]|nr:lipoprotein [Pseudomonadota bacterium]
MKKTAVVALIALSLLLAGCGNKGSLVKPSQAVAATGAGNG